MAEVRYFTRRLFVIAAPAVVTLSGCAVTTPAAITTATGSSSGIADVNLLTDPDDTGLRAEFASELESAFSSRGVTIKPDSAYVADYSVSAREAGQTLDPVRENQEIGELSGAQIKARWYDECKPHRVSASLVVYERASGDIVGKSEGEFIDCPGEFGQLGDLAGVVTQRALQSADQE